MAAAAQVPQVAQAAQTAIRELPGVVAPTKGVRHLPLSTAVAAAVGIMAAVPVLTTLHRVVQAVAAVVLRMQMLHT